MTGTRFNLEVLDKALADGALILVPNNRMRDAMLYSLARREPAAIFRTPDVQAVDIWVKEHWEQLASQGVSPCDENKVLSAAQEALVWTQLVEQSLDELPLLNPEETARAISHAYQLMKQWQLDQPDQKTLQQFTGSSDVACFLQWSNAFKAWCEQQHSLPLVEAIRVIKELIPAQQSLRNRDIVLVNFLQPPPLYRALFEQLSRLANVTEVTTGRAATGEQAPLPVRRAFSDPASEIRACARWAAALARQDPDAHIGVICPNRKAQQEKFTRALADALHPESLFDFTSSDSLFNSAGASSNLLQSGLIFDAFLVLGLVRSQQLSVELCRLLHSPYIVSEENGCARQQMELLMRRRFTRVCQQQEFSYYLGRQDRDTHCPELARALVAFRTRLRAMPKRATASAWMECFRDLLHCLGWPGPHNSPQEQQLLRQWREVLRSFAAMGDLLGSMTAETALARLRQLCQDTPQFRQTGLRQAISFYSVTEAQGLQFDYLWLLGFDDQSWPTASGPSPFLPYALQLENDIPGSSSDIQFRLAQTDFTLLLASVKQQVVASFAESDGEQQFRPSSFILPFSEADSETDSQQDLNAYAMHRRRAAALKQRSDATVLPAPSSTAVAGGHSVISNQSACPFRAFVLHRLQTRPLDNFPTGLTALARGSAIHLALDRLYGEIDSLQALLALDQEQRRKHSRDAAAQAVEELARRHPQLITPRFRQIEQQRLTDLLEKFLELETRREPFTVVGREQRIPLQLDKLQLSLVVDRIDRLADQSLAILDYKTGKTLSSRQSWLEERPEDMQLPVYMVAASSMEQGQVSVISLAQVNTEKLGYSALAAGKNFASTVKPVTEDRYVEQSWQELEQLFRERVTRLADEFQRGVSHVDPVNGDTTCQYCGLQPLCRIRDFRRQADSNGDFHDEAPA